VISIWAESLWGSGDGWRPAVYTLILALAAGHTAILLAAGGKADDQAVRQVRGATILALWILVGLVFVEISSPGPDLGIEVIGVFAVLYLLGVLLLPLVRRSSAIGGSAEGTGVRRKAAAGGRNDGISLSLDHLVIGVADWDRSTAFYRDVLGAEVLELEGARMAYRIGSQQLNAHGPGTEAAPLALDPVRPGNSDLCFAWNGSAAAAVDHLRSAGVEVLAGPVPRDGAHGTGLSVYCRDPDGSLIELIAYG
jgi:catechol 2,3-dioxygenase-like lactoylglutathione lyase family enzyme